MVPTELLAVQHYQHLLDLLEKMEQVDCKPSVALLTGSTSAKQSRLIREACISFLVECEACTIGMLQLWTVHVKYFYLCSYLLSGSSDWRYLLGLWYSQFDSR